MPKNSMTNAGLLSPSSVTRSFARTPREARKCATRWQPASSWADVGRAALGGLERLAEAALADREDVFLRVHARGQRPHDVFHVVDVDVLVDHDAELGAEGDGERRREDVAVEPLVARAPLLYLEDHPAP